MCMARTIIGSDRYTDSVGVSLALSLGEHDSITLSDSRVTVSLGISLGHSAVSVACCSLSKCIE